MPNSPSLRNRSKVTKVELERFLRCLAFYFPLARYRLARQTINPLVVAISRVAAHPMPLNLVPPDRFIQFLPEIDIRQGASLATPVLRPPLRKPFGDASPEVLGIGEKNNRTGSMERLERLDRCSQFHAVVGCLWSRTGQDLFTVAKAEQGGPTSRPRVGLAGAIRIDRHVGLGVHQDQG